MTISDRDKRALIGLGAALVVAGIVWVTSSPRPAPKTVTAAMPV